MTHSFNFKTAFPLGRAAGTVASGGLDISQRHLLYFRWCRNDWVQKASEILSALPMLSKTSFCSLVNLEIFNFCRGDRGWFARTLCWLASS